MVTINNATNNQVGASNTGVTNTFTVTNPSDTASSQANIVTTVGGTTAGDAWNQFSIGSTTSMALGLDNSDSDKLKITYAASASINPSSGTTYFDMLPTTGAVIFQAASPANALGIVSQPTTGSAATGYRGFRASNASADAAASITIDLTNEVGSSGAGLMMQSSAGTGSDPAPSFANKLGVFANIVADGIVYSVQKSTATHTWYTGSGGVATLCGTLAADGTWTYPLQPAFFAYLAATALNKTGNGTAYTLGTDALTEVYDQNSDFNTNGTFTAPVTGIYDLRAQVTVTGATIATTFVISIVTTLRTYIKTFIKAAGSQDESVDISVLAAMTATNTATVTIAVTGEGADTDDILGAATAQTFFCGHKVA